MAVRCILPPRATPRWRMPCCPPRPGCCSSTPPSRTCRDSRSRPRQGRRSNKPAVVITSEVQRRWSAYGNGRALQPGRSGLPVSSGLVVPVMVTDHDAVAVVIMVVPAAVPTTVMAVEPDARAVVAIAIVVTVAADAHAEFGGAGDRRHADRDGREGSQYV